MFNIPPASLLGIDSSGLSSTPKTPEIVNSLIAMTNPMDSYNFGVINSSNASTPGSGVCGRTFNGANMQFSQDSSHSSSSASPLDSPAGTNTTPSVQQTRSQLIKAGLKLSIQSKRKLSTCDSSSGSEQPNSKCSRRDEDCDDSSDDDSEIKSTAKGLTPEDEDRRRRRRERNKIAATKCRLKKRERTQNLIKESEQLDTQNVDLKNQVRALEMERRKLLDMLQAHGSTCIRRGGLNIPPKLMQSPAQRYLADLDMDGSAETNNNNSGGGNMNGNQNGGSSNGGNSAQAPMSNSQQMQPQQQQQPQQRTVIPPMSTIKFSRSNDFKATASLLNGGVGVTSPATQHNHHQHQQQQQQQQHLHQQHQQPPHQLPLQQHNLPPQLPQGYCKPSPTPQELGYLNSPSQESICLPSLTNGNACNITAAVTTVAATADLSQLSEYIPNCDNSLGLVLTPTGASATNLDGCSSTTSTAGDSSSLISGVSSPLTVISSTPSSLTSEFVKNEMVDSHSPYTTAASAERFLFEGDIDIKHAISIHQHSSSLNHLGGGNVLGNNNNNLLDFHSSLMGGTIPLHEQISIKNDFLNDADLLGQFTDAGEFVDLDTGVAAAFMTNGGCLA